MTRHRHLHAQPIPLRPPAALAGGAADILGPAPRWQAVPASQMRVHPHAAIANLRIHVVAPGAKASFFAGTGWFAAPDRVVTAAHVLDLRRAWSSVAGATSWHVEVVPAVSATEPAPFGSTWATRVERHPRFVDDIASEWDLAVLIVTPLPGIGAASVVQAQAAPAAAPFELTVAGYPWQGGRPDTLCRHAGPVLAREGAVCFYDIDTEGGQSGSPLLWQASATAAPVAVGLHTGGQGHGTSATARALNTGIGFDATSLAWIMSA